MMKIENQLNDFKIKNAECVINVSIVYILFKK